MGAAVCVIERNLVAAVDRVVELIVDVQKASITAEQRVDLESEVPVGSVRIDWAPDGAPEPIEHRYVRVIVEDASEIPVVGRRVGIAGDSGLEMA